jgi:hypothetical protein
MFNNNAPAAIPSALLTLSPIMTNSVQPASLF